MVFPPESYRLLAKCEIELRADFAQSVCEMRATPDFFDLLYSGAENLMFSPLKPPFLPIDGNKLCREATPLNERGVRGENSRRLLSS